MRHGCRGFSAIELVFVAGLVATVTGIAVPPLLRSLETYRAAGAARYVATRLQRARMEAVLRSADVAVRFTTTASGYAFAVYVDGDGDGVSSSDVASGVDRQLGAVERVPDNFAGVEFGTLPGLPPVDAGSSPPGSDPIRLGASSSATFTPAGTSSSGSLYLRGQTDQYVVRIFGQSGKTRILRFNSTIGKWVSQ